MDAVAMEAVAAAMEAVDGSEGGNDLPEVVCQICKKPNHTAVECYRRFDISFAKNEKSAGSATTSSYGVDMNWYLDTGATDHIISELDKLTVHNKYNVNDQVHTANGEGMEISHIGHTTVRTPTRDLHLKNILHVPDDAKNLISSHRLSIDNHTLLEVHPTFFSSRNRERGKPFFAAGVDKVSTPYHRLPLAQASKRLVQINCLLKGGTVG